ncbi:MAG TPA: homoserine dehydrogenase [Patescibacteria group bacterium]|nr:homoserine dehydrogenase [Patescibacteria group bacterium]
MRTWNLAMVGFGNVGREFVRQLVAKQAELRDRYGIDWRLTGVASRRIGWLADPAGFDPARLLAGPPAPAADGPQDVRQWLAAARADILFEASSLNRNSGQPAIDHLRAALESGAHAISANKGPVVYAYRELRDLAASRRRRFFFESTVMDGTPVFSLFAHGLPAADLHGFRGILNSTTNVVLTEMERGIGFDDAVKKAQEMGIAETDPTDDLEGWDSAVKVAALVTVLMGRPLTVAEVDRTGIGGISAKDVREALAAGRRYRLVCQAERNRDGVRASVRPESLPMSDPLAMFEGNTSALYFDLDVYGLTVIEHRAGVVATAYGLLADFIRAVSLEC